MIATIAVVLLAILVLARARHRAPSPGAGTTVRRFFQYLLLVAMEGVLAVGATGVLTRLLDRTSLAVDDRVGLARDLAFIVVGAPTLVLLAVLTRRQLRADPQEARLTAWALALGAVELTAAVVTMQGLQDLLLWLFGGATLDAGAGARVLVWGALWAAQVRLDARTRTVGEPRPHRLAVAVLALWTAASGLASLVAAAVEGLLPHALLADVGTPAALRALAALLVGTSVWGLLWRSALRVPPVTVAGRAYLVVAGVGGGTIAAVVGAAVVLDRLLVWWIGTPSSIDLMDTVRESASAIGALVAGLVVRQVHVTLLARTGGPRRDEPQRIADYATTGIALAAIGAAGVVLTAALLETVTQGLALAGPPARNTLLLACTLLLVGGPLWAVRWQGIRAAVAADPVGERASVARRVLLVVLFGVVGLAAVGALIVAVAFTFDDLVSGRLGLGTLRRVRWAMGVVVSGGVVAAAHWRVFRADRAVSPSPPTRQVLLVGPMDATALAALTGRLHAHIDLVPTAEPAPGWDVDAIATAIEAQQATDVVVVPGADGPQVLTRGRASA